MKSFLSTLLLAGSSSLLALALTAPASAQSEPRPQAEARVGVATPELTVHTLVAQRLSRPSRDATPGREVVDGVNLELAAVADHESPEARVIKLRDQGVYVAQDLLYNGVHLWAVGPTEGWRTALKGLRDEKRHHTFLAGHGPAGDRRTIEQNLTYLDTVDRIRRSATGAADDKAQLLAAYPAYAGAALLDIYLPLVHPAQK